ncbi:hypothetical protein LPJ53_001300 [Coemansia erecta]|uniref:Uncharacterized protein n=1 Tax=Coemansia erecta TaxID=147472 RepID=A0A9W7Y5R7_9FUNG|nr:hypothetical protein LPJ53_001300 [Coemansia erecta]
MSQKKRKNLLSAGTPTLLNLKAAIEQAKTESARPDADTDGDGQRRRPTKRLRVSDRRNKGIDLRAHRDLMAHQKAEKAEDGAEGSQTPTHARIRQALEEKAKIYDMLTAGGGVSKADLDDERIARILDESSVDFVGMMMQRRREEAERGRPGELDDLVDVVDEFGRTRRVLRSKAHQYGRIVQADGSSSGESSSDSDEDSDSSSSSGSSGSSSEHDEWVEDAGFRRNHAPGYYKLSTDRKTRKRQLKELRELHEDTVAQREAAEAPRAEQQQENEP